MYGMGEKTILDCCDWVARGMPQHERASLRGVCYMAKEAPKNAMETDARSKNVSTDEFKALAYWPRLLEALMERKPSLLGFFQKSKGYYNKEKGFLIKVASEFAASLIAGPDISLTVKTLLSEFEGRNVLSEPFTVLSDAKVKNEAIHIIDELEELIGQND